MAKYLLVSLQGSVTDTKASFVWCSQHWTRKIKQRSSRRRH